jgi:hypothetical protein
VLWARHVAAMAYFLLLIDLAPPFVSAEDIHCFGVLHLYVSIV